MAKYDRMTVLNAMVDIGLVPVFYNRDLATTISIIEACAAGGARVVEFTNRGDLAWRVFADAAQHVIDSELDVILGVGSIVDAPTAGLYISSGANFVVGPLLNPEVARLCNRRKVPYSPGCGSVSEIGQAEELGVEICPRASSPGMGRKMEAVPITCKSEIRGGQGWHVDAHHAHRWRRRQSRESGGMV